MSRASCQRVITLALSVLNSAAYKSTTQRVDTAEVRLALAALWLLMRDRSSLAGYHDRARHVSIHPWEGARDDYWKICATLRAEGWHAPADFSVQDLDLEASAKR